MMDRTNVDRRRPEYASESEEEDLGIDPKWFERATPDRNGTQVGNPYTEKMPKVAAPRRRRESRPDGKPPLPPPEFFKDPPERVTKPFAKLPPTRKRPAMVMPEPTPETAPTDRGAEPPMYLEFDVEVDVPLETKTPIAPSSPPPIPMDARPAGTPPPTPSPLLDQIAPTRYTPPSIPIPDPPPLHAPAEPLYRTPAVGWVAPPPLVPEPPPAPPADAALAEVVLDHPVELAPIGVTFVPVATPTPETEAEIVSAPPPPAPEPESPEMVEAQPAMPMATYEPIPDPEPPQAAPPVEAAPQKGKVVLLFGCRGGSGATTLSVNIAAAMAREGKEVCLVDLDLQLGDVFVSLDLDSKITLANLAREAPLMDAAALRRRLPRHESGVYALSQAGRVDDIDPGLVDQVPTLLAKLASHFDVVLIDGVRDFGDFALAALDSADEIALVFTQDVPSVRRAGRIIQVCKKLGYPNNKLRLVVNRFTGDSKVSEEEVERALGLPVLAKVANDYRATRRAQDDGVLLTDVAKHTKITRNLRELAHLLLEGGEPPPRKAKGGLFSRFLGGK